VDPCESEVLQQPAVSGFVCDLVVFIIQYCLHSANDLIFYQNLGRSISGYTHLITSHIGL